jgi:hypothetical protein
MDQPLCDSVASLCSSPDKPGQVVKVLFLLHRETQRVHKDTRRLSIITFKKQYE